jgi:predicted ATPase/DNA-binding winged helix-turn-helix (wHTH) protein
MQQQSSLTDWASGEVIHFGPFRLSPRERRLERDGEPVKLGDRALDLLLCLVANAPEVVSKTVLTQHAWPNAVVEEGNLRFQISVLRRALAEGGTGDQYLTTVQGRGYCFVAPVTRLHTDERRSDETKAEPIQRVLPPQHPRIVGRNREISQVVDRVVADRFVTLVGPGGVGKTTVALAASHALLQQFQGAVRFIDLGALEDRALVPTTLASIFGLTTHAPDPIKSLVALIEDQRILLVFDSCEHVIDVIAQIAEALYLQAPGVHMLLTSREPLRTEGEHVIRLLPLESPQELGDIDAVGLVSYPAARLFVDRVSMAVEGFELKHDDAAAVAEISRRLDGIPLAIELAAGSVLAFGIDGMKKRLNEGLPLVGRGRRTAPPRHQTLDAMLDWSYDLLTEAERKVLQRLSTLVSRFSMEAAQAIGSPSGTNDISEALAGLVAKSLVSINFENATNRFRLLDTTRAYALQKLHDSGEFRDAMKTQGEYLCSVLDQDSDAEDLDRGWSENNLGNVRAALEWCFSPVGDGELAVRLGAAATAVFLDMSLWAECKRWTARSLAALSPKFVGSRVEMKLRESFGLASMFTEATNEAHRDELQRCLEIAESLDETSAQLRAIGALNVSFQREGEMAAALELAQRSAVVAESIGTEQAVAESHWFLVISHHLLGNQVDATAQWTIASNPVGAAPHLTFGYGLYDHRIRARCAMARALWLRGYHRQAIEEAEATLAEAFELRHPVSICIALIFTGPVFMWNGDLATAERIFDDLVRHAEKYSFVTYLAVSHGLLGELKMRQGFRAEGIAKLRSSLAAQHGVFQISTGPHTCALAEGLLMTGQIDEGLVHISNALTETLNRGGSYYLPEILRVKAMLQFRSGEPAAIVESTFQESIATAERQGALSLLLQSAISLLEFCTAHARSLGGLDVLRTAIARFPSEESSDLLRRANERLRSLEQSGAHSA